MLWDLSQPDVEDICIAWRKGLIRVWGLPYRTHSALLYRISNMLPLRYELANRVFTFVHKSLTCNNYIVNFVVRHGVFFGRMLSPIGRNVQFSSDLFGVPLNNLKIDKKQVWNTLCINDSPMLSDRVSVITELLSVKCHHAELALFSAADINFIIDSLCVLEFYYVFILML